MSRVASVPSSADELRRVMRAAHTRPAGELPIWTQRTRLRHDAAGRLRREYSLRRLRVLDPIDDRVEQLLWLRAVAAAAMGDARRHEQARELLLVCRGSRRGGVLSHFCR